MPIIDSALPTSTRGKITKCKTGTAPVELSRFTLWRRAHGRPSQRDKAAEQQYLTPYEESALLDYVLHMSERGYMRSLALMIAHQRSFAFQISAIDDGVTAGQELATRLL
jgi:hypothetical protein